MRLGCFREQLKGGIALVKNGYIREIGVAAVRAQAVMKRENILLAIEQAEMPLAWRHRYRMEHDRWKRRLERSIL